MDATDPRVVAEDEEVTQPSICGRCLARAAIDAAIVRARVSRLTLVSEYIRPLGGATVERVKAWLCLPDGRIAQGAGHSREDAIEDALQAAGVA